MSNLTLMEAERGILSALMTTRHAPFVEHLREKLRPEHFRIPGHDMVYNLVLSAQDETSGIGITPTLIETMARRIKTPAGISLFADMGNMGITGPTLQEIYSQAAGREAAMTYTTFVLDQHMRSRLHQTGVSMQNLSESSDPDFMRDAEQLFELMLSENTFRTATDTARMMNSIMDALEGRRMLEFHVAPTGLHYWDGQTLGGFVGGRLYGLAGLPGHGKTRMALSLIINACVNNDAAFVGYFLEHTQEDFQLEVLSACTGPWMPWILTQEVPPQRLILSKERIRERMMKPENRDRLYQQKRKGHPGLVYKPTSPIEEGELYNAAALFKKIDGVLETEYRGPEQMRALVRRTARKYDKHVILCVDHANFAASGADGKERLDALSQGSKLAAVNDGRQISSLVLSQYNREHGVSQMKGKAGAEPRPITMNTFPSHLIPNWQAAALGSGNLSQDPDTYIMLMQPALLMSGPTRLAEGGHKTVNISFRKNRDGPIGDVVSYMLPGNGVMVDAYTTEPQASK